MRRLPLALLLAAAAAPAQAGDGAVDPKAQAYFTDNVLVDQDGREVRFYSDVLKDRTVVIDFIFTRCSGACPLLTQKLRQLKDELGDRVGEDVLFVSISIDPKRDTPEDLRAFAERHRAAGPGWIWLTGEKESVDGVVKRLGQYVESIEGHSTIFIAGNVARKHWAKLRSDSPAEVLAEHVRRLADGAAAVVPAAAR